jgi:hypothetical protein
MRTTQQLTNLLNNADRSESPVRHGMLVSPSIIEIYNYFYFWRAAVEGEGSAQLCSVLMVLSIANSATEP